MPTIQDAAGSSNDDALRNSLGVIGHYERQTLPYRLPAGHEGTDTRANLTCDKVFAGADFGLLSLCWLAMPVRVATLLSG